MRTTGMIGAGLALMGFGMGCQSDEAYWAVQHAEVTLSGDTLTGYQTWEFYSKKWGRSQKEKFHLCARVQSIEGTLADPMTGCESCDTVYEIVLAELETDCAGEEASSNTFRSASHFALGPISGELDEQNAYPEAEHGWYVSWDSVELEPVGYAWPASDSQASEDTGLSDGGAESLVLWPGYAWQL